MAGDLEWGAGPQFAHVSLKCWAAKMWAPPLFSSVLSSASCTLLHCSFRGHHVFAPYSRQLLQGLPGVQNLI